MNDIEDDLYDFLKHGDREHRVWLRKALEAFFNGKPRPLLPEDESEDEPEED